MTHKIATIHVVGGHCRDYNDYDNKIVSSISEWEDVDDDTFNLLVNSTNHLTNNYQIIEHVKTDDIFVIKNVKQYIKMVEEQKRREDEAEVERAKKHNFELKRQKNESYKNLEKIKNLGVYC